MKSITRLSSLTWSAISLALAFGLSACGDNITEQINANVGAVATSDDLPECTESIAGQTAFVKETHEFLGCDGKDWQTLSANTVSVGDNVCTSTSLSDDSGFEIFCNGQSIGKVRNGEKGDAGAKGDSGAGCKIQESTALTATIACGSETFTMDFTGYVDVSAECDTSLYEDCTGSLDNVSLSGMSQKGPFVIGTDITAYELENGRSLKQTGKTFGGKIERADGTFDIKTIKLKSTFAYIVADGFYRNEVTGENSSSAIKLRAFTNLQGRTSANINLVTHLEYDRVQYLVTKKDSTVAKAKMAAEKEIFAAFGIDNSGFKGFAEDLNILQEGDGNAALLAISVMLQGNRTEAELSSLLASLSVDLGDNGKWDNQRERVQIADWAMKKTFSKEGLASIRKNVEGWKLAEGKAPAFEKYVTNFWMTELDVPACTKDNANILFAVKNKNSSFYAKNDSVYVEGDSSLVRLTCAMSGDSYEWRLASDIEKDTAAFVKNLPANTVATGKINTDLVYVKEGKWRHGTELDLALKKACVADSIGVTDTMTVDYDIKWFICSDEIVYVDGERISTAWRATSTAEADTAGFGIPQKKEDSVKIGNINKSHYYVFDNGKWRFGTELDKALGVCDTTKLNTLANLQGRENDPNAWYTCVDNEYVVVEGYSLPATWRKASDYEMDTYGWLAAAQGTVDSGKVNKNLTYVYEGDAWRPGTRLDRLIGTGCIRSCMDTLVSLSEFAWYTCVADTADNLSWSMEWRKVTDSDLDEAFWNSKKNTEGTILEGPFTKLKRVWDNDTLREPNETEYTLGRACVTEMNGKEYPVSANYYIYSCGDTGWTQIDKIIDLRDSTIYRFTRIGGQIWMAENLNYNTQQSSCYEDDDSNCTKYGRLYEWDPAKTQGCPEDWHLPTQAEWNTLISKVGGASTAGKMLKSTSGWTDNGNGSDSYSFTALPAGRIENMWYFNEHMGDYAYFWTSSETDSHRAGYIRLSYKADSTYFHYDDKYYGYSVRCVQD